ncbi:Yip1 family protein [Ruminiclostridium hungatei]|nr:Yip1 family protein [Ruminiclostridium hungatei]
MKTKDIAEPAIKRTKFFGRILGVITSPQKTMEEIAGNPRTLFPFFLVAFGALIFYAVRLPLYKEMINRSIELQLQDTGTQVAGGQEGFVQAVGVAGGLIGTSITSVVIWLITTLAFFLLIKVFKGEGTFKQYVSVIGYSYIINALYLAISLCVSFFTDSLFFDSSVAGIVDIFVPDLKGKFVYGFLRGFDLFGIWQYAVMGFGVAAVSKIGWKKVWLATSVIFLGFILLNAGNMSNM